MSRTPSSRTIEVLKKEGWCVWNVECWMPHAAKRLDLFGFGDTLAVRDKATLCVQSTSTPNIQSRVKKILANPYALRCHHAGWVIEVWGWKKYAKKKDGRLWRRTRVMFYGASQLNAAVEDEDGGFA